jgi:hypothetical protein
MKRTFLSLLLVATGAVLAEAQPTFPVWGSVPSPNASGKQNVIHGIAASGFGDVWAVGEYNSGVVPTATGRRTVIEHWDGIQWSVVPSSQLDPSGYDGVFLEDIVALGSNDLWAVGHADDYSSLESATVIAHYDGSAWTRVTSPNPGGSANPDKLMAVAALGPNRIYAVGTTGYPERSLILRWNGVAWQPVPNNCQGALQAISIAGPSLIFAASSTQVCRFDGSGWSDFPVPSAIYPFFHAFRAVAALSENDVWVAGARIQEIFTGTGSYFVFRSQALHWNGSQWTEYTNLPGSEITALLAATPTRIWGVGTVNPGSLILEWDGVQWSSTPAPSPLGYGHLRSITRFRNELWAAGSYFLSDGTDRTLIVRAPSPDKGHIVGDTDVSGAVVSWFGPVAGSDQADSFGDYEAVDLPVGTYTVIATFGGCTPASATVEVLAGKIIRQGLRPFCF